MEDYIDNENNIEYDCYNDIIFDYYLSFSYEDFNNIDDNLFTLLEEY